jgi:hypothetical protein
MVKLKQIDSKFIIFAERFSDQVFNVFPDALNHLAIKKNICYFSISGYKILKINDNFAIAH